MTLISQLDIIAEIEINQICDLIEKIDKAFEILPHNEETW